MCVFGGSGAGQTVIPRGTTVVSGGTTDCLLGGQSLCLGRQPFAQSRRRRKHLLGPAPRTPARRRIRASSGGRTAANDSRPQPLLLLFRATPTSRQTRSASPGRAAGGRGQSTRALAR